MNIVQKTFKEIATHIVTHDTFDNIFFGTDCLQQKYDIECHCGKRWSISLHEADRCNIEGHELMKIVNEFNTPEFHNNLASIKEKSIAKTDKMEDLLEKTQSPTISCLEI